MKLLRIIYERIQNSRFPGVFLFLKKEISKDINNYCTQHV